jgi:hypothetical protein
MNTFPDCRMRIPKQTSAPHISLYASAFFSRHDLRRSLFCRSSFFSTLEGFARFEILAIILTGRKILVKKVNRSKAYFDMAVTNMCVYKCTKEEMLLLNSRRPRFSRKGPQFFGLVKLAQIHLSRSYRGHIGKIRCRKFSIPCEPEGEPKVRINATVIARWIDSNTAEVFPHIRWTHEYHLITKHSGSPYRIPASGLKHSGSARLPWLRLRTGRACQCEYFSEANRTWCVIWAVPNNQPQILGEAPT